MYSLFIDTHSKNVLIILFKDGKIMVKNDVESKNKHSEITMPTIIKTLEEGEINVHDLNLIIVVNGPGSFTGERIAVTIAKTLSYTLDIPIKVIDSLTPMALSIKAKEKIVSLEDKNGAFIGIFDENNNKKEEFKYLNKSDYEIFKGKNKVVNECDIDYEEVFKYVDTLKSEKPHSVKPLYIKGISALNDR